jgi:hypothetical protein
MTGYQPMVQDATGAWYLPSERPDRRENGHPAEPTPLFDGVEAIDEPDVDSTVDDWPAPPGPVAFHGLAGRVVQFVDPFTEADPVAVLGTFLTAFGCALNAGPHARVGPERHPARLFVALIGRSSTSRKGSSWAPTRELLAHVDPEFVATRVLGGLGSGEALIHAVRDGDGDKDPGITDKRALVFAPEFATILRVMGRQGSILSGIVKEAWDSGRLQNIVKTNPATATGAHVAILAHTTADELARDLTDTDARSGFGNRFVYLAVRRSKRLPSPPSWDDAPVGELAKEISAALDTARRRSAMARDAEAEDRWRSVYDHLTRDRYGLAGILTSRAEAQVLRLSLTYALLDGATAIGRRHLDAALALWDYAERSAVYVFGQRTGDPIADRIVEAAGDGRVSRSDIFDLFGRHVSRSRIDAAIFRLIAEGLVTRSYQPTGGRRIEFVEAVRNAS